MNKEDSQIKAALLFSASVGVNFGFWQSSFHAGIFAGTIMFALFYFKYSDNKD